MPVSTAPLLGTDCLERTPSQRSFMESLLPSFLTQATDVCPNCGFAWDNEDCFCRMCGTRRKGVETARREESEVSTKVKPAWIPSSAGPQAVNFYGEEHIDTIESDFDFIFIFANPGHHEEYCALYNNARDDAGGCSPAERTRISHDGRRNSIVFKKASAVKQKSADHAATKEKRKEFKEEAENKQKVFLAKLLEREKTMNARELRVQEANGTKMNLRCATCKKNCEKARMAIASPVLAGKCILVGAECNSLPECEGRLEEVSNWCQHCAVKVGIDLKQCSYCHDNLLSKKARPLIQSEKDMEPKEVIHQCTQDLLKSVFVDPRQGEEVQISPDIETYDEAQRAVIDMFLSFFRDQDEEQYYTYVFKSVDFDEIFLCVKMSENTARRHAEVSQYCCLLDNASMTKPWEAGGLNVRYDHAYTNTFVVCNPILTFLENSFARFFKAKKVGRQVNPAMNGGPLFYRDCERLDALLTQYKQESLPSKRASLRKQDRIRLLYDRLTDVMNLEHLRNFDLLKDYFPLHTKQKLSQLKRRWASVGLSYKYTQPMHLIHVYFGEHIALYFIFVEFVLEWMLTLVIVSLILTAVELYVEVHHDWNITHKNILRVFGGKAGIPELRIAWCFFVIFWCQFFEIKLKRMFVTKLNIWGLDAHLSSTVKPEQNPTFNKFARFTVSETNENEVDFTVPWKKKMSGRLMSNICTAFFLVVASAISCAVLWLQAHLYQDEQLRHWSSKMSYVLFVVIKIVLAVWDWVGSWLVDHEYWDDRSRHDNAMAYKNFFVQVLTTFCTFFYIAFLMKPLGDQSFSQYGQWQEDGQWHISTGPWQYLTYQMLVVFGLYLVYSVADLIGPFISFSLEARKEKQALKDIGQEHWKYSFIEAQAKMTEYDGPLQNDDYMQIILPCGFVLFFGATAPLSAFFCYIYTTVQLRVDAWKLCKVMRRPYPRTTEPGKWVWKDIIEIFLQIATFTNIALICVTMKPIAEKHWPYKLAVGLSLLSGTTLLKWTLCQLYPEVSQLVELARKRHAYQRELTLRMFKGAERETFMNVRANKHVRFDERLARLGPGLSAATIDMVDKVFESACLEHDDE